MKITAARIPAWIVGRFQTIAWLFVVAAIVTASVVVAQAWDRTAYDAAMNHKGEPSTKGIICRNEAWYAAVEWYNDDIAVNHVAADSVSWQIIKAESELETLETKYSNAGFHQKFSGGVDAGVPRIAELQTEIKQLDTAQKTLEERRQVDLNWLEALYKLPPCETPVTPPPPPPPMPPYPPGPNDRNPPPYREPHHVVTSCAKCKSLADQVNDIIDELKDAWAKKHSISKLQSDMQIYARALNVCERTCLVQPPQSVEPPGPPPPLKSPKSKASNKRGLSEDSPLYMDNYKSTAKPKPHTTHKNSDTGGPSREDQKSDEPDNDKSDTKPEIPIPH
ncbi:MAG: hypothetical protein HY243_15730 [Proteobacteria bacterium]|nr:hypothetical protein [Pseudomonadota bacterium]